MAAAAYRAKGLARGAHESFADPFHPDELAARVRAVIRRSGGAEPGAGVIKLDDVEIGPVRRSVTRGGGRGEPGAGVIKCDDVEIDLERRMVTRGGELVQLSRTEWLLLQHLAANAGKVVLHTQLLTKVR